MVYPVQLLSDEKGIYGIGVCDEIKHCLGANHEIILRPDKLWDYDRRPWNFTALQMIPGSAPRELFKRSVERRLQHLIHLEMLRRAGFPVGNPIDPFPQSFFGVSAEGDQKAQADARRKYHGLRRASYAAFNNLMREALGEAANFEALRQVRRFRFCDRYELYREGAISERFSQLMSTFPVLAVAIACGKRDWRRMRAMQMVEDGAPLRDVARRLDIPFALRRVKPGAAHVALVGVRVFEKQPELIHAHMPRSLADMTHWLSSVLFAASIGAGTEFAQFIAVQYQNLEGGRREKTAWIEDTADWVRACIRYEDRDSLVSRPFSASMSLKTVIGLSNEWHDAVAHKRRRTPLKFPEPWASACEIGEYEISPIQTETELYHEGRAMRNCVADYAQTVASGQCYIYSLRKDKARIATVELTRRDDEVRMGQVRGPCNQLVDANVSRALRKWMRSQSSFRLPSLPKQAENAEIYDTPLFDPVAAGGGHGLGALFNDLFTPFYREANRGMEGEVADSTEEVCEPADIEDRDFVEEEVCADDLADNVMFEEEWRESEHQAVFGQPENEDDEEIEAAVADFLSFDDGASDDDVNDAIRFRNWSIRRANDIWERSAGGRGDFYEFARSLRGAGMDLGQIEGALRVKAWRRLDSQSVIPSILTEIAQLSVPAFAAS